MKWHIGCSGFHYRDWKEVFYPSGLPQKKWFEFYSSRFDTLELNVTFYRFPQVTMLENWYKKSPAGFLFSVKAPRLITHYKQLNDCEKLLDDFYSVVQNGLEEKLGTLLFQFPPSFSYTAERLEKIRKNLRPGFRNVIEFRHNTWWSPRIYRELKKDGIIFSGISHPSLPNDQVINNSIIYYRFHGVPRLYYSAYEHVILEQFVKHLSRKTNIKEVYVFFNNTATMGAIENAVWLREEVEKENTLISRK